MTLLRHRLLNVLAIAVMALACPLPPVSAAPAENDWEGTLAVGQNADGRLELFKTNTKGTVLHRWQKVPNGEWSPWASLGGVVADGITVSINAEGKLELFAVDKTRGSLKCIEQKNPNDREWGDWVDLGGNLRAPVTVGVNPDNRLEVFAVDATSHTVKCRWQNPAHSGWSAWLDLGGDMEPGLVVARNRDGDMELFGVDREKKNLVHCWQNEAGSPGQWLPWDNLGGSIVPGFAVGRNVDGRLEIFARNSATNIMERIYQMNDTNGVRWSAWGGFGEPLLTGIAVGQNADGRLEVFAANARGTDVMHRWQFKANGSENWSAWWSLWGAVQPFPVVGRNQDGNLELFAVDRTNHTTIQHKRQISANLDWLDWFSMDQPVFPYATRTWQTEDGLPHNVIQALAQTPDGYMWVGTQKGLARFDGLHFTTFDAKNTPAMKSSSVLALSVDHAGTLWIGTDKGVLRMTDGVFARESGTSTLDRDEVGVICEGKDDSLWFGTTNGLNRYQNGRLSRYTRSQGLLSENIRTVFEDVQTNLWIGTDAGLNRLNGTNLDAFDRNNGLPDDSIRGITQDKGWRIWIGSDNGMIWFNTGQFYAYGQNYGLSDGFVSAVREDHDGNLWVGTHSGLNRFREGRFFNELKSDGTPYDKVNAIFEDREGNLWVGSNEGLIRLTPRRFFTYNKQEGLTHNNTYSVLEDSDDSIWTATYGGGLNSLQNGQVIAFTKTNGLTSDLLLSLGEGQDGSLWIGGDAGGGLYQLKNGGFKHYTAKDGLPAAAIKVIHEDRSGALWLGTDHGLSCLKDGKFSTYTAARDHLAGDNVRDICENHAGSLWFGTDGGLSWLASGIFKNFTTNQGLSDNSVMALFEDAQHSLWIGTENGGLNRYQNGRFKAYTRAQGLFSDEIFAILEDDYGWLWMSCAKGVFRVRKADLDDLDQGRTKIINSIPYGKSDGMAGTLCNGAAKPAGWKGNDGRLWFVTTKGLIVVDPNIRINATPPPVFIEQIIADGRPVQRPATVPASKSDPLRVPPGRGGLEFIFSALNFENPEAIQFKYMLEGWDSDWIKAGSRRVADYNNIYPGKYSFRVIACNSDGVWNTTGATVDILIRPHLWESPWFRTLAIVVILGSVGGLARYVTQRRMRRKLKLLEQQNAIERERGRIAKDMHDELGSNLTRIMMLGQRILEDGSQPGDLAVHAHKIVTSARATVQSLDEIVWAVNPANDTLDELVGYLNQYASQFFEGTNVKYRLEEPRHLSGQAFPAEIRHNLFLAIKEALNNVLKHSQATEVHVSIHASHGQMEVTVADNGRGFNPGEGGQVRRGNGLENMRKRMAELGGEMQLTSAPGQGTELKFVIALNR
ncbi:MAG: two-component regulator propeller domain-containing protein [Verrucomicrobiae bacterium]|nr:two-component regulator propeller domain-containing protein [Verrucomicrobiae bacterium]